MHRRHARHAGSQSLQKGLGAEGRERGAALEVNQVEDDGGMTKCRWGAARAGATKAEF